MGIIERAVLAELSSVRLGKIFERTYISLGKGWLVAESGRFKCSNVVNYTMACLCNTQQREQDSYADACYYQLDKGASTALAAQNS